MKEALEKIIIATPEYKELTNKSYSNSECIGTLHIYEKMTKKMEFIPGCEE